MKIHQLRIDFNVTEEIKRFVYVYIIESSCLYLIDSGVYGSESIIIPYIESIGRKKEEIRGIFLTHAHPDHIGTAAYFREKCGCKVYASYGEKPWIEDIDLQFKERPIPGFYNLAGKSSAVDTTVEDGDILQPEKELTLRVVGTPGHSADEVSYIIDDNMFIGDTVPVKGEIPIYINKEKTMNSLNILDNTEGVNTFYPAWDKTYTKKELSEKTEEARHLIRQIDSSLSKTGKNSSLDILVDAVCSDLDMPFLKSNPLFIRTVSSHIKS
ncbi:MAG: MBL fold metallo-hydrolase [Bacillota bacterium]|nr:MBL fold metallo-hydrolase [Bacillota bacterium]